MVFSAKRASRKRREQDADLIVDVGNRTVVGSPRGPHLRIAHRLLVEAADVAQAL